MKTFRPSPLEKIWKFSSHAPEGSERPPKLDHLARKPWTHRQSSAKSGFTLVELLVVIAVIAILASLLLPALAGAKKAGQAARCRSNLREMGIALQLYVDVNNKHFPAGASASSSGSPGWFDALYPQRAGQSQWTNALYHCPTYLALKCLISPGTSRGGDGDADDAPLIFGSYAYNNSGLTIQAQPLRGLAPWPITSPTHMVSEAEIKAPAEMYSIADSRPGYYPPSTPATRYGGLVLMQPWLLSFGQNGGLTTSQELPPTHSLGYQVVFVDGHVASVKRTDYLYPPRTAQNWNGDNQPHAADWAPTADWAVTK